MMLKSHKTAHLLLSAAACLPRRTTCSLVIGCVSILLATSGCRQAGAPMGSPGMAPITGMPGQTPMTGPTMPALGPFGASARVPPPATGSYGNANGQSFSGTSAMPANYAPPNIAPMAFNDASGTNGVAVAGGFSDPQSVGVAAGSSWQETSANPATTYNPNMDLSRDKVSTLRSGGMQVNDLTGAPPPPGYAAQTNAAPMNYAAPVGSGAASAPNMQVPNLQNFNPQTANLQSPNFQSNAAQPNHPAQPDYPQAQAPPAQYPTTTLMPLPSTNPSANSWAAPMTSAPAPPVYQPSTTAPVSGGGFVDASPAANQPSMSTADRPVQWQTPRR